MTSTGRNRRIRLRIARPPPPARPVAAGVRAAPGRAVRIHPAQTRSASIGHDEARDNSTPPHRPNPSSLSPMCLLRVQQLPRARSMPQAARRLGHARPSRRCGTSAPERSGAPERPARATTSVVPSRLFRRTHRGHYTSGWTKLLRGHGHSTQRPVGASRARPASRRGAAGLRDRLGPVAGAPASRNESYSPVRPVWPMRAWPALWWWAGIWPTRSKRWEAVAYRCS